MTSHGRNIKSLEEPKIKCLTHLNHFPKLKQNLTETNTISAKNNNFQKTKNHLSCDSYSKSRVDNPFDSLATAIVASTVNYLIKKSSVKEKAVLFEKNKLCKLHYPLIYIISNRKTNNNSSHLMEDLLNNDNAEFKKIPKSIISRNNTPINHIKNVRLQNYSNKFKRKNFNNRYNLLNDKYNKVAESLKLSINNTISNSCTHKRRPINVKNFSSFSNNKDFFKVNNSSEKIKKENRFIYLKNFYSNDRGYLLGNETVNLFNHRTNAKNRNILNSKFNRVRDNDFETIIKDISLLKSNNRIMPLQTNGK